VSEKSGISEYLRVNTVSFKPCTMNYHKKHAK